MEGKDEHVRGGSSTVVYCQADNCTADLTEAKKYHRRHKVCEFHAKAPVVIVAGIGQRFCQQCSRHVHSAIASSMACLSLTTLREAADYGLLGTMSGDERAQLIHKAPAKAQADEDWIQNGIFLWDGSLSSVKM